MRSRPAATTGHPLEVLLVRLLFCLFADDTGIFQPAQAFRAFIEERTAPMAPTWARAWRSCFRCSTRPRSQPTQPALDAQLAAFPYINGKLFEEACPWPTSTAAMREALLDACALDWSAISPAIFGSLFQSIMDEKARRNLGAHYTARKTSSSSSSRCFWMRCGRVREGQGQPQPAVRVSQEAAHLTFFDPACGCGNFLVISYRELRLLELDVLRASHVLSGRPASKAWTCTS
jgi:hypothetical protein